jgi:hypothetical protein
VHRPRQGLNRGCVPSLLIDAAEARGGGADVTAQTLATSCTLYQPMFLLDARVSVAPPHPTRIPAAAAARRRRLCPGDAANAVRTKFPVHRPTGGGGDVVVMGRVGQPRLRPALGGRPAERGSGPAADRRYRQRPPLRLLVRPDRRPRPGCTGRHAPDPRVRRQCTSRHSAGPRPRHFQLAPHRDPRPRRLPRHPVRQQHPPARLPTAHLTHRVT